MIDRSYRIETFRDLNARYVRERMDRHGQPKDVERVFYAIIALRELWPVAAREAGLGSPTTKETP